MNLYISLHGEILRDDFGLDFEKYPILSAAFECDVPISFTINDKQLLLVKFDSIVGPVVVGIEKDEIPMELIRNYVERTVLERRRYPREIAEIAQLLESWKGERTVGVLDAGDFETRINWRNRFSQLATQVVNIGKKDLYVFPSTCVLTEAKVRFCLSSPCTEKFEAVRQALVVDRYVRFDGVVSYDQLLYHDAEVEVEQDDLIFVEKRLLHHDLEKLSKHLKIPVQETYKRQLEVEQKYWLFFGSALDEYLYCLGVKSKARRWQRE